MASDVVPVVELEQASKTFGDIAAVQDLNVAVGPGQIFGLIGPSGCGKTTTIRMMLGVLRPSSGAVRVMNADPTRFSASQRERIGYTPQGFFLYPTLTVKENVHFVASLFGLGLLKRRKRAKETLQFLELWDARNRLSRDLSGGMKRRLELACALVHQPELLFVDEPTAGLDPMLRSKIWDYLRELRDRGTTVFVTTQYIDEIEHCDNVAILNLGRLAAVGSPTGLRRQAMGGEAVDVEAENLTRADLAALRALPQVTGLHWGEDGALRVVVNDGATATPEITRVLQENGVAITAVRPYQASFEDVFKKIVGAAA